MNEPCLSANAERAACGLPDLPSHLSVTFREVPDSPECCANPWHLIDMPGKTACGADYPNMQATEVPENVTCMLCLRSQELYLVRQRAIESANVRAQTRNGR